MSATDATVLALVIAGAIAPWLIEVIKQFIGNPEDKKAVILTIVASFAIGIITLIVSGIDWTNNTAWVQAGLTVLGVANTVYQFFKKQIVEPVAKLVRR